MRVEKSNFTNNLRYSKNINTSKQPNILDLIERNRAERKKEEIQKIYTMLGCGIGLFFIFGIFVYF